MSDFAVPTITIRRDLEQTGDLQFDSLFREARSSIQKMAGERWTDFNLHDPGVTILEQLCYAASDLAYRADFPVGSYLADANGSLDRRQMLLSPREVFPCQASTETDLAQLIFSEVPSCTDVGITPAEGSISGLYRVRIAVDGSDKSAESKVRSVLLLNRQLGEDTESVETAENSICRLTGTVEISGEREPWEICAEIYFRCAECIASDMIVTSYEDRYAQDSRLEELFCGPFTPQGWIDPESCHSFAPLVNHQDLVRVISSVEGVTFADAESIRLLYEPGHPKAGCRYELILPDADHPDDVLKFRTPGSSAEFSRESIESARRKWEKLKLQNRALRNNSDGYRSIIPQPELKYEVLSEIHSIQNDFPDLYGINRAGVPPSAGKQRAAQARQLKAYLYPFEQITANFCETFMHMHELFSTEITGRSCYFSPLSDQEVPGISELYSAENWEETGRNILSQFDSFADRKNRIFDLMAAMYGESFPSAELARCNPFYRSQTESVILYMKARFLRNIAELTERRTAGAPFPNLIGGWEKRIRLLLGILCTDSLRKAADVFKKNRAVIIDREPAYPVGSKISMAACISDQIPKNVPVLTDIHLSRSQLAQGCDLSNYFTIQGPRGFELYFQGRDCIEFLEIHKRFEDAVSAMEQLYHRYVRTAQELEMFYTVEHILCRPRNRPAGDTSFYSSRATVVFPAFGPRFSSREFHRFSEKIIAENSPAHLYVQYMRLDVEAFLVFEQLYWIWANALLNHAGNLDECSANLVQFLTAHESDLSSEMWV